MLFSAVSFGQTEGYNAYDSSVIPSKKQPQQNEFINNTYNFPARPRNMLEVGASFGLMTVSGDVSSKLPTFGGEIHVRKALGYLFSLRLQYVNGTAKGLSYVQSENYARNDAWVANLPASVRYNAPVRLPSGPLTGTVNNGPYDIVFYNYKTHIQDLSIQGIFTLNNVRFHKQKSGFNVYVGAGIGGSIYHTKVNAYNESKNTNYAALFKTVYATQATTYKNRKNVRKALKDGMDDTYETDAQGQGKRRPVLGNNVFKPSGTVLAGIAFKLSKRVNLALEDRFTIVKDDLLDGQEWQEHPTGDAVLTTDFDSYNYLSIGINVNVGSKSVEPLWWVNPLDYAYDELKKNRTKVPKPVQCEDADGDGVCDHLDREPNTPAGCAVDTHGVTRDTDGDGVPDCKDKQLITPTECQPVDADGVGKCPTPDCCKNNAGTTGDPEKAACPCDYPTISFKGNSLLLSGDAKAMLASVAAKMKDHPDCKVSITGYWKTSKAEQAVCNKRNEAITKYLVEKEGISADRIASNCDDGTAGDKNTVDIKCN